MWAYGAQSYRPFGTAAQLTVVSDEQAVRLPAGVSDDLGACLGIPGITAQIGSAVAHSVALDQADPAEQIRAHAPEGVHRIIEVAFSDNADLDARLSVVAHNVGARKTQGRGAS